VDSSDEHDEDDESVVEMFPAKKKRKAPKKKNNEKVAENFAFFELPKGRTGRKKQLPDLFKNATRARKADTTNGTTKTNATDTIVAASGKSARKRPRRKIDVETKPVEPVVDVIDEVPDSYVVECLANAENEPPVPQSPPRTSFLHSPLTLDDIPPLNAAKAILARSMNRGPFASTPVGAAGRRPRTSIMISSVKKHDEGHGREHGGSPQLGSPISNRNQSSKRFVLSTFTS
jgi:hypothetical protein